MKSLGSSLHDMHFMHCGVHREADPLSIELLMFNYMNKYKGYAKLDPLHCWQSYD